MRGIFRFILGYLGLSAVFVVLWLIAFYPKYPKTISGWLLLFALVLPVEIASGYIFELLWKNRVSHYVELKTSQKEFSWLRVGYGLLHFGVIIGVVCGVVYWFDHN